MNRSTIRTAFLALAAVLSTPVLAQDEDPNARFRTERERLEAEYLAADRAGDLAGKRAALEALESLAWEERQSGDAAPAAAGSDSNPASIGSSFLDLIVERPAEPGASNSVELSGTADASFSSFYGEGGKKLSIRRKSDGTVEITVETSAGGGLDVALAEAEAGVRFGDRKDVYGIGFDASVKAGVLGTEAETWTFREDETAEMLVLLAQEGFHQARPDGTLGWIAEKGLETMNDVVFDLDEHRSSEKHALGVSAESNPEIKALIDVVGVEGKAGVEGSVEHARGEDGNWDLVVGVKGQLEGEGAILGVGPGGAVSGEWKLTVDESTGDVEKLELVYVVKNDGSAGWDAYEDMFAESMDGAAPTFSIQSGSEVEIRYELADPEDHVVSAVRDRVDRGVVPTPSALAEDAFVQEVERHGEIVLLERETGSFGIGGAGEIGAETQKIGLGAGVEGASTSEREVWRKTRDGKK